MIIRNIWCVGRNYADHAAEMKSALPTQPMIFLKAGSSASINSTEIELPYWAEEVHHEAELCLKFGPQLQFIEGALALDLTERKIQAAAKSQGHPWTLAKSFSGACAVSAFFSLREVQDLKKLQIKLWVNDVLKQDGSCAQMIFDCESLRQFVLEHFPVCAGDLLLTGTPAGVGPLISGDSIRAEITGHITHRWKVFQALKPAPVAKP